MAILKRYDTVRQEWVATVVADPTNSELAEAWAEGTEPGGAGTKSAKEWANTIALGTAPAKVPTNENRDRQVTVNAEENPALTEDDLSANSIEIVDTLTADRTITVPDRQRLLPVFQNNTTGDFAVTVKTASGGGVPIAQGGVSFLYSDGTDVRIAASAGATGGGGDEVFVENDQIVTNDYEIPEGKNAMSTGPITIEDGVTVTVPDGSNWTVI